MKPMQSASLNVTEKGSIGLRYRIRPPSRKGMTGAVAMPRTFRVIAR
jgi:hypothetical protein